MDVAEFDKVADQYEEQHRTNIAITGEGPEFFAEYKIKVLSQLIQASGLNATRLLDFGSGIGNSIPYFRSHIPAAKLTCADVSNRSLELAETRFGAESSLLIEADRIPAPEESFDVIFSACVFHHIRHDEHVRWLEELLRVAAPGALLVIFEHNPLNPLTRHAVNTCPFDANARLLTARTLASRIRAAGWHGPAARYHVFFPHALATLRPIEPWLSPLPLGGQYSVAARKDA